MSVPLTPLASDTRKRSYQQASQEPINTPRLSALGFKAKKAPSTGSKVWPRPSTPHPLAGSRHAHLLVSRARQLVQSKECLDEPTPQAQDSQRSVELIAARQLRRVARAARSIPIPHTQAPLKEPSASQAQQASLQEAFLATDDQKLPYNQAATPDLITQEPYLRRESKRINPGAIQSPSPDSLSDKASSAVTTPAALLPAKQEPSSRLMPIATQPAKAHPPAGYIDLKALQTPGAEHWPGFPYVLPQSALAWQKGGEPNEQPSVDPIESFSPSPQDPIESFSPTPQEAIETCSMNTSPLLVSTRDSREREGLQDSSDASIPCTPLSEQIRRAHLRLPPVRAQSPASLQL